jgi:spore coat polysaccharide biosynthesis protein SpsF
MSTAIVVQARMSSSRLPGKVLLPVAGAPVLQRQIERIQVASPRRPFELVVATTIDSADDPIAELCRRMGVACFRGHPTDLLQRHLGAAALVEADVVVKIPSDCPLIDPLAVALVLDSWNDADGSLDYLSNLHPATWPDGNDVEVMSFEALAQAARDARAPHEREHTTPFLWDNPDLFRIGNVIWPRGLDLSLTHRFTLDYREDWLFIGAVYRALWTASRPIFGLDQILAFLEEHPEVMALNADYAGVNWYRHHLDRLRTITAAETRHEPKVERA